MTKGLSRRQFATIAGAAMLAAPHVARGQAALARVRFTMDWAFQGPSSYALLGREKGFFREAGIDIQLSRGFGSGRVPVDIAAGAYDMGQGDINPTLKFMADNPDRGLVVVAIAADRGAICATVRGDGPINSPRDLEGKTLAAPEFDAGRQIFPAFARAAGIDARRITWMSVQPELREPMLVQRRADGITGILMSTALSLKALGMDWPAQRIMLYRDFGLDLYATCYITTQDYLRRQPDAVRGTLRGLFRSIVHTQRNPAEAIEILKRVEPLTDVAIETERQRVASEYTVVTDNVRRNGLSSVDPARLQLGIRAIEEAYGLTARLRPEDVYTDAYLPPRAERMLS
ncbi:MAG: ABC transporter substrate-binding protein [Alphaproteobacteria bacterium]|nr:ABC transporter substrate-binding protein [Alphaproteobacteria bacterium]